MGGSKQNTTTCDNKYYFTKEKTVPILCVEIFKQELSISFTCWDNGFLVEFSKGCGI